MLIPHKVWKSVEEQRDLSGDEGMKIPIKDGNPILAKVEPSAWGTTFTSGPGRARRTPSMWDRGPI